LVGTGYVVVFLAWKSVISTLFSSGKKRLLVCTYAYAYVSFGVSLLLMLVFDELAVVADSFWLFKSY